MFVTVADYPPNSNHDSVTLNGYLSGDDTVIAKPYSDSNLTELIGYFWSGLHHRPIKGINSDNVVPPTSGQYLR